MSATTPAKRFAQPPAIFPAIFAAIKDEPLNRDEASAAISAAFAEVHATCARTEDADERQLALLRCYGRNAQIQAETFFDDLLVAADLKPGEDLAARGQVAVDEMLEIFLRANAERGLDFPEFVDATKNAVTMVFFQRLNELLGLAIQPPQGSA